ncbi:MAG: SUMF1/EgtB/PvdO family nonheme iron enzyme [Clostridia bacterium]|nr:SUMF1/EgtB/PvdO family nonheme iron enzyme [Clostridia bacterium]
MEEKRSKLLITVFCIIFIIASITLILTYSHIKSSRKKENIANDTNSKIENETSIGETAETEEINLYDYKNPIIPEGFKKVETAIASWNLDENGCPVGWNNGLVIEDNDGNQFVWIPVKNINELKRKDGYYSGGKQDYVNNCKEADDVNSTVESKALYESIRKYKGFYIARYEAGIENELRKNVQDGTIKPLSKQDVYVWNKIRWGSAYDYALDGVQGSDKADGAVKVARSMYPNVEQLRTYNLPSDLTNTTGVISTLCYGIQWDLVIEFMEDVKNTYTNNKYVEDSTDMGWFGLNSKSKLQLTGTNLNGNESNCVKNIYDMAGNIYEWTMESYKDNYRIYRGGMYEMGNQKVSASTRGHSIPDGFGGYPYVGFRVALYLK